MINYYVKHLQLRLFLLLVFHIKFEREGDNKNHNVLYTSTGCNVHSVLSLPCSSSCHCCLVRPTWCKNRSLNIQWSFIVCLFFTASFSLSIQSSWLNYLLLLFRCILSCFNDAPIITIGELYSPVDRKAFYADKDRIWNCHKTISVLVLLSLHECDSF